MSVRTQMLAKFLLYLMHHKDNQHSSFYLYFKILHNFIHEQDTVVTPNETCIGIQYNSFQDFFVLCDS